MIERLLEAACRWLARRCQLRPITREDGQPYLDRYYLFGAEPKYFPEPVTPRLGWLPFCVFLHHFRDSDRDVELHSHPWAKSTSLILTGGYTEERREEGGLAMDYVVTTTTRRPGSLNRIASTDFHRVLLLKKDAWTLFVTGRKASTWFFWHPKTGEVIPWKEHIARRKAKLNAAGGRA